MKRPQHHSEIEFVVEKENLLLTFTIAGTITAYNSGCCSGPVERCYPPEGGELEDVSVLLTTATTIDTGCELQLSREEILELEEELATDIEGSLRETIQERMICQI